MMAVVGSQQSNLLVLAATAMLLCLLSPCPCVRSLATPRGLNSSEIDRLALACLRSHLSDPSRALDSWRNESISFCSWRGVSCSRRHAGRVVALDLASLNISGQISPCIGDLPFLNRIDMARNQISGNIPAEIGRLIRLRYLNLSMNGITGLIPETISSCSRLEVIRLRDNFIQGEIPPSLTQLQFLQDVTLSNNNLSGSIPPGIGSLPNLKFLFLPNNNLEGNIPEFLGSSPLLSMVAFQNNILTGGIPPLLANCSSLNYLDLMKNKLSGQIPSALFNNPSLANLDLSHNGFSGPIPSSSLLSSPLKYISLASNNLSGGIPATLGNFSLLTGLLLSQNSLQGGIPESLARIPRLETLDMAYNNLSGTVPSKIYNITSLTYLGLGANHLVGRIPTDIGRTLPNIQTLVMEGNMFEGPLPLSLLNATNLQALELRDNALTGVVPSFFSLPNMIQLDLGSNLFEAVDWSSLTSTFSSTTLQIIYLDSNKLQGKLPNSIGNLSRSVQLLFLTENRFTGTIPPKIGNITDLTILQLEGNLFSGSIPDTLGNLRNLFVLSLAHNILSGEIPQTIGNLERLSELYLQGNNLSGSIPTNLGSCKQLVTLNLSHNDFQGSIPPELLSISSLSQGLDLSYNRLTGSISSNIGALINLESLDISNNQLSGEIPHTLGACLHLISIRLKVNFLQGSIPSTFVSLRGLTEMDLSQNNLSGEIPNFLETFSALQLLNLSFNNLEGVVPTGGPFSNSSKVFVQGNRKLCASHPMLELPVCMSTLSKRKKHSYVILITVPLASLLMVLTACTATILLRRRRHPNEHIDQSYGDLKKFSYTDLAKATNNFSSSNLVGSGRYALVYKGTLEPNPAAIKVFKLDQIGAPKNFFSECEVLRNTRHRNLMQVISLCSSLDRMGNEFKALILEYMDNGSLESWLHPDVQQCNKTRPLTLGSRIMIALDVAAALDYLHNQCCPPLVHCDLKPSNVLLDNDMVAHVSDFGLTKFLRNHSSTILNSSTSIVGPRGSIGYIAPEYGMGREISTAGDVYSYGIILLEMVTGKHPTDEMFKDGLNLRRFVESAFPQNVCEILESGLIPSYDVQQAHHVSDNESQIMVGIQMCTKQLTELGIKCSADSPTDRPGIQNVYSTIMEIRETFSTLCIMDQ